jgi:hypothetical protein
MIGYLTTHDTAASINEAIAAAQTARGLPVFWLPGMLEVFSGPHAGLWFVPADDALLNTPLIGTPAQTPQDFPEFADLIAMMGGLEARTEIDPADIIPPSPPEDDLTP